MEFPPLVIRASAGTGKTYALATRFLSLLMAGVPAERILATTFTRKAAWEIEQRVFLRLADAALNEGAAGELASSLNCPGLTSEDAGKVLLELVGVQHRLRICTLDSFFHSLARNFSFELGLLLDWELAHPASEAELEREALLELFRRLETTELSSLLRLFSQGSWQVSLYERFRRDLRQLYTLFREAPESAWQGLKVGLQCSPERLKQLRAGLEQIEAPKTKQGQPNKVWEAALRKLCKFVAQEDWTSVMEQTLVRNVCQGEYKYNGRVLSAELQELLSQLQQEAQSRMLERLREETIATHKLLSLYDCEVATLRQRRGLLTFSDIKYLLARQALLGNLNQVYFRLDASLAHLLLDEFQDTSRTEWDVLEPIADEVLAKSGSEYSFFCVGDVKQAIYGWRGGVAEIFDSLEKQWPQLEVQAQDVSWRCAQAVVDTVNKVFLGLAQNPALEKFRTVATQWQSCLNRQETKRKEQGYVALLVSEEEAKQEDEDAQLAPFKTVISLVAEVQQAHPLASIGVLTRRNEVVGKIINALAKAPYYITASEEGGVALAHSAVVSLFLSLLRLVDHPGDSIASFHVFSSPLGAILGLSDYQNVEQRNILAVKLREQLLRVGYGATLSSIAAALGNPSDHRERRRLEQLLEIAYSFGSRGLPRTREFLDFVQRTRVEDPSLSPVKVMTIHQAKGLEFDYVILPELDLRLLGHYPKTMIQWRPQPFSRPTKVSRQLKREVAELFPELNEMFQQMQQEELKEALSVLYVAMTRARDGLYMLVAPDRGERKVLSYASILRAALASEQKANGGASLYQAGTAKVVLAEKKKQKRTPQALSKTTQGKLFFTKSGLCRRVIRKRPSDLEGGKELNLETMLLLEGQAAQERKTLLHLLFSALDWLDNGPPAQQALIKRLRASGVSEEATEQILDSFLALLKKPALQAELSQSAYQHYGASSVELRQDLYFAFKEEALLYSGKIDRLVIGKNGQQVIFAEVLVFKTEELSTDKLEARKVYYQAQLQVYRQAVARQLNISLDQISAKLLFVEADLVAKIC